MSTPQWDSSPGRYILTKMSITIQFEVHPTNREMKNRRTNFRPTKLRRNSNLETFKIDNKKCSKTAFNFKMNYQDFVDQG